MISSKAIKTVPSTALTYKLVDYIQLGKLRLSLVVVFSAGVSFLIATPVTHRWIEFAALLLGGLCLALAANAVNEILERRTDALMQRTANRPLPTQRMEVTEAVTYATVMLLAGAALLGFGNNWLSAALGVFSFVMYAFIYTPLKRKSSLAVFAGAVPGALPTVIGWAAATGEITTGGWVLFAIQFVWQLPHFWAIAWVADDDYRKAGFSLLPMGGKKGLTSALHIAFYTLLLIPIAWLPLQVGLAGYGAWLTLLIAGALFFLQTVWLIHRQSRRAALMIMFGSFVYLPVVLIAILLDKLP